MSAVERIRDALPEIDLAMLPQWAEWLWSGFGCCTMEIAEILDVPEADAQRALDEARGIEHAPHEVL